MKKQILVISLGGSLIIPKDKFDSKVLDNFKKILRKSYKTHKFVVVTGGGSIARKYIAALRSQGKSKRDLSLAGIRATRMNSRFLMQFFGKEANQELPCNMKEVKSNLAKNSVVFCGALRYDPHSTSDGTAAKLANYLGASFVNITNVSGLYSADPKKNKNAKFISNISWRDFEKKALSLKFKAGQHFVLDQNAATLIRKNKIKTYIIGGITDLDKIIKGKKFKGTTIEN